MLGSLISAGASLLGGIMGNRSNAKANEKNEAMQRDFANNSIAWRVADAKRAGIHPVYALGAPTMSVSPSHVGDTSMPAALSQMGQDVGRAVNATRSGQQKMDATVEALTLTRMGLENDLLASQIAQINQGGRQPNFPGGRMMVDGQGDVPEIIIDPQRTPHTYGPDRRVNVNSGASDAQVYEDRYGDSLQEIYGIRNWLADHYPWMLNQPLVKPGFLLPGGRRGAPRGRSWMER